MDGTGGNPLVSVRTVHRYGREILSENPFSTNLSLEDKGTRDSDRIGRPGGKSVLIRSRPADLPPPAQYPVGQMAETLPKEGISARLAEIRGQLKLLSDYL
jgi:hypothetical protein